MDRKAHSVLPSLLVLVVLASSVGYHALRTAQCSRRPARPAASERGRTSCRRSAAPIGPPRRPARRPDRGRGSSNDATAAQCERSQVERGLRRRSCASPCDPATSAEADHDRGGADGSRGQAADRVATGFAGHGSTARDTGARRRAARSSFATAHRHWPIRNCRNPTNDRMTMPRSVLVAPSIAPAVRPTVPPTMPLVVPAPTPTPARSPQVADPSKQNELKIAVPEPKPAAMEAEPKSVVAARRPRRRKLPRRLRQQRLPTKSPRRTSG